MSEESAASRSFGERFAGLVEAMHPADREPYSDREIAEALGMSRQYIWQLRTGQRGEPRQSTVREITRFFGVPDDYFDDDEVAASVDAQIEAVISRRDAADADDPTEAVEARRMLRRLRDLSPQNRQAVSAMIDSLADYDQQPRSRRSRRKPDPPSS